jgi:glutamate-1-semialdehyde 2,1-aminomutase
MEAVAPQGGVYNAGTFNGNPLSLTAGMTTIDILQKEGVHWKLNDKSKKFWQTLMDTMRELKKDYTPVGIASMFQIFFGAQPENYDGALKADRTKYLEFWRRMLEQGIFLMPSQFETNFLSAAHTQADYDRIAQAVKKSLEAME